MPGVASKTLMGLCALVLAGCSASRPEVRFSPQILQLHHYLDSWAGEYRGRVDHGRWHLSTGSTSAQAPSPSRQPGPDDWQWEKGLRVDLTIRFVPDETGGALHLSLSQVDTFQVQPWKLSQGRPTGETAPLGLERQVVDFAFTIPRDLVLIDEHRLAGTWYEDTSSPASRTATWNTEKKVEVSLERRSGEVVGSLKYRLKVQRPGVYRFEERHEMALAHLWKEARD